MLQESIPSLAVDADATAGRAIPAVSGAAPASSAAPGSFPARGADSVPVPVPASMSVPAPSSGASVEGAPGRGECVDAAVASFVAQVPGRIRRGSNREHSAHTRDSVPVKAGTEGDPVLSAVLQEVWDATAAEGPVLARKLRAVAKLWAGPDETTRELPREGDLEALTAAVALRTTRSRASFVIRDAHHGVDCFVSCVALLEAGRFPAAWFERMLVRVRALSETSLRGIDAIIARWDLRVPVERFHKRLGQLIAWAESIEGRQTEARPIERSVFVSDLGKGMACLQVQGPAPEIHAFARRLDVAAKAVQSAQRAALRESGPDSVVPWDVDGMARKKGAPLRRDVLRYLLATRAVLDTEGIEVPRDRFRISVTVPMMTLLGMSDAPGTLDGVTPVPAGMARALAGGEGEWYRVLTDPCTGAFVPAPAQQYRPSPAMLEYVRLGDPTCAVPGCGRSVSWASQADHIQEWLEGGATSIENLHLLCERHHQDKTARIIDPERVRPTGWTGGCYRPGVTRWLLGSTEGRHVITSVHDDWDMIGLETLRGLVAHYREHPDHGCDETCLALWRGTAMPAPPTPPPPEARPPGEGSTVTAALDASARPADGTADARSASQESEGPEDSTTSDRPGASDDAERSADGAAVTTTDPTTIPEPPGGWGPQGPPPF